MHAWQIFLGIKLSDSGPDAVPKSRTALRYHRLPPGQLCALGITHSPSPIMGKRTGLCSFIMRWDML